MTSILTLAVGPIVLATYMATAAPAGRKSNMNVARRSLRHAAEASEED